MIGAEEIARHERNGWDWRRAMEILRAEYDAGHVCRHGNPVAEHCGCCELEAMGVARFPGFDDPHHRQERTA